MIESRCTLAKKLIYALVIIGAINWGLVGAFKFDLVAYLFGNMTYLTRLIYILVGLAGLAKLRYLFISCKDS